MGHAVPGFVFLILAGCAQTPEQAFEKDVGYHVPIFMKGDIAAPLEGFTVVRKISVTAINRYQWRPAPDEETVRALLRIKARKADAHALIDVEITDVRFGLVGEATRKGSGKAIRYK